MKRCYLMNTTMMPNAVGSYKSVAISASQVDSLLNGFDVVSAIGHESSAVAMTNLIGRDVKMSRITVSLNDGDTILAFKLRQRPPEGAILDLDTLNAIGYDLVFISYRDE